MKITVSGSETVTVSYDSPKLISDIIKDVGMDFSMPCSGHHSCGKCRVSVSGCVSEITEAEKALLSDSPPDIRLACFTYALGDSHITLPQNTSHIQTDGIPLAFKPDPSQDRLGFAVDIGTTTVVVYGYDLSSGQQVCRDAFLNPQRSFGGDVISRIEAAIKGEADALSQLIVKSVTASFKKLCQERGIAQDDIHSAVITGNTTMLYLLAGIDVTCLSAAPFEISDYLGLKLPAERLGIKEFKNLSVYLPPTVSAFVGSDISCSMLACTDFFARNSSALMIDIGTNGEMALIKDNKIFCCSTAAGPAFEGTGITFGCMAQSGAINSVAFKNGEICYSTIGGEKAIGICGSGLIDAIAALVSIGVIDETGLISEEEQFAGMITEYDGQPAIRIADSDVLITQKDVRALQLAKSAIRSGIDSLLNAIGISENEIDILLLAGGFGSYINAESAAAIGLIPEALKNKAQPVGNAAGMGAVSLLLSESAVELTEDITKKAETLDLASSAFFMEKYVENMMF